VVSVALWSAPHGGTPHRLPASPPDTEAELENWVKSDPSLVRDGLVAQQLIFRTRERLDLLCIENRSRWLIVELKRDRLAREVAAQALDYVSLLADMSREELRSRLQPHLDAAPQSTRELVDDLLAAETDDTPRELGAVIVGISADEPLLRITRYLADHHMMPMAVVELQAFTSPSGDRVILREETGTEADASPAGTDSGRPSLAVEERWAKVHASAESTGFGAALHRVEEVLRDSPVYLRPYTWSIMITPPNNRTRYLGVIGFTGKAEAGTAHLSYGVDAILEFFPRLTAEQIRTALGESPIKASPDDLIAFSERLAALLAEGAAAGQA